MYSAASQSADKADLQQEATEQAHAGTVPFNKTQSPASALYVGSKLEAPLSCGAAADRLR